MNIYKYLLYIIFTTFATHIIIPHFLTFHFSNGSKKSAFASLSGGDYREANDQQISTKNEFISKTKDNRSSDKDCIITIDEEEDTEKRHETRSLVVGASKIIEKKKTALTRVQDTVAYSRVQSSALLSSQSGGSVISNRLENLSPSSTKSKPKWTPPNKAKKKKLKIDAWPSIHVSTGPGPHFLHIPPLSGNNLSDQFSVQSELLLTCSTCSFLRGRYCIPKFKYKQRSYL